MKDAAIAEGRSIGSAIIGTDEWRERPSRPCPRNVARTRIALSARS